MKTIRMGAGTRTIVVVLGFATSFLCSCRRDAHQDGKAVPPVAIKPTDYYGVALHVDSTPEEVAFVVLRAIREDVEAKSETERKNAQKIQHDLCAANEIAARNPTGLPNDEYVQRVVKHWAPTVSHYVGSLDTKWEKAKERLVRAEPTPEAKSKGEDKTVQVIIELRDPAGDPNDNAVLMVYLAKDSGLWLVLHLGFDPNRRSLSPASKSSS